MGKKILLVGEEAFILTSLKQAIIGAGHEVIMASPTIKDLNEKLKNEPELVMIYGGDYVETSSEPLVFLRDYVVEHEIKVGILGYKEELDNLKKLFPLESIWTEALRPFNVKEIVEKLNDEMEKLDLNENKKHIMVVDDSGTMLRTVKSWLSAKYKVTIASSAAMAISLLANAKPDLILLDYEMPVCSGPQFLEMIRGEVSTQNIPVIFLTAKNDADSVKAVLSLKPDGYLLKTMNQFDVVQNIDDFFAKQKAMC